MKNQVTSTVHDLNATELAQLAAKELSVPYLTVDSVLKELTQVCIRYIGQGYSFSLSDDVFFRVGYTGQRLVDSGMVIPKSVIHRAVSESSGVSKPVVDGVLDRCMSIMVSNYLQGASSSIYGLLRFYPKATLSYNRVSYGGTIKTVKEQHGYRIQLVLSKRLRNHQQFN